MEKQLTTPQQYPLTLNALVLACNQSTNREPVMALDEEAVARALQELKDRQLARFVLPSHGKSVTRYRQVADEAYGLDEARVALLAGLLLRGPQTVGELRGRTGRMADFDSLSAVQSELEVLAAAPEPLVRLQPRQPGRKEDRWQQLLAAETGGHDGVGVGPAPVFPSDPETPYSTAGGGGPSVDGVEPSAGPAEGLPIRIEALESEIHGLRDEVRELRDSLAALRRSLGD